MKKILLATAALVMVAAPIAASAQPFDGRGGREVRFDGRGDRRGDDGRGGAVAAGLFGLFLGAALASNHSDYDYPRYGAYADYGYGYRPYRERCEWETRAYPGPWGGVTYQNVQVCR